MIQDKPIAAIATADGVAAISLIRCSGKEIINIVDNLFKSKTKLSDTESNRAVVGWLSCPESGEKIDQVVVTIYRSPKSYTGEDIIEISLHGGKEVSRSALDLLLSNGCEMARPGEFTKRAFLNNKKNIFQAEAVNDIIRAQTAEQRRMALFCMEKETSEPFIKIKDRIEKWLMLAEASIEFPEEEHVEKWDKEVFKTDMGNIARELDKMVQSYKQVRKIREGLLIPIAGKPNAGKSTLLNFLCKSERVIVDHEPGTTRDAVEEELEINGRRIRIVDTAGIRETQNRVELKGIEKTAELLEKADLVLWVHDCSKNNDKEEDKWLKNFSDKPVLHIYNKIDLADKTVSAEGIGVSLTEGTGTDGLLKKLEETINEISAPVSDSMIFSVTQQQCAKDTHKKILALLEKPEKLEYGEEIISIELKDILASMEPLTGITSNSELLDRVFNEFCIGK